MPCSSSSASLFEEKRFPCDLCDLGVTYVTFEKTRKYIALDSVTFSLPTAKHGRRTVLPPHLEPDTKGTETLASLHTPPPL
jgi:hypothetical protein